MGEGWCTSNYIISIPHSSSSISLLYIERGSLMSHQFIFILHCVWRKKECLLRWVWKVHQCTSCTCEIVWKVLGEHKMPVSIMYIYQESLVQNIAVKSHYTVNEIFFWYEICHFHTFSGPATVKKRMFYGWNDSMRLVSRLHKVMSLDVTEQNFFFFFYWLNKQHFLLLLLL